MRRNLLVPAFLAWALVAQAHAPGDARLAALDRKIAAEPTRADLYVTRGDIRCEMGQWDAGLRDYERAASHDPELDLDFVRGRLHLAAGEPETAQRLLGAFVRRHPNHAEALAARARALSALGRQGEAADSYTRALDATPAPSADLYLERAQVWVVAGEDERALRGLDEAAGRLGRQTALERQAVEIEIRRGRYDEALGRLDALLAHSPLREQWQLRRGEVLELADRPEEACTAYRQGQSTLESRPARRRESGALSEVEEKLRLALERMAEHCEEES